MDFLELPEPATTWTIRGPGLPCRHGSSLKLVIDRQGQGPQGALDQGVHDLRSHVTDMGEMGEIDQFIMEWITWWLTMVNSSWNYGLLGG